MGIEIRGAQSEHEVDDAYELASKVFGPNYFAAREMKVRARLLEPVRRLSDVILAMSAGDVVGLVRIVDRQVSLGEARLSVGGITSVCLRPDFQGQGYGRAIMEEAIAASRQRRDVLSIAFARRAVDGFYPRLGYVGLGCHPAMIVKIEPGPPLSEAVTLSPQFDERLATDVYGAAYEDSYRELVMSFFRDAAWWASAPMRLQSRIEPDGFVTVREGKRPVGYFIAHGGRVVEAASVAGSRGAVLAAILIHFGTRAREVVLALPLGHWAMRAFQRMNHTLKVRYSWDGGHMVRVLDSAAFCAALAGAVNLPASRREPGLEELRQFDVGGHEGARALLQHVAGCVVDADRARERPLLATLPAWSLVDEF